MLEQPLQQPPGASVYADLRNSLFEKRGVYPAQSFQGGTFWLKDMNDALASKHVQRLVTDPLLLDVVQDFLGVPPILRTVDVWVTLPSSGVANSTFTFNAWHIDFNTVRGLKDQNLSHFYELHKDEFSTLSIEAAAGAVVLENTRMLHRAAGITRGHRVILQLDFMANGYCCKFHHHLYTPLNRIPSPLQTHPFSLFPRLFQRMVIENRTQAPGDSREHASGCVRPIPTSTQHAEYVHATEKVGQASPVSLDDTECVTPARARNLPAGWPFLAPTRVVVINLPRHSERLAHFQRQASQLGILSRLRVQPGVDGRELGETGLRRYAAEHLNITRELDFNISFGNADGVFGCTFSHMTALQDFLQSDDEFLLLMEDDIYFDKELEDALQALRELGELQQDQARAFDILWLCFSYLESVKLIGPGRFKSAHLKLQKLMQVPLSILVVGGIKTR
eukprot:g80480.t1